MAAAGDEGAAMPSMEAKEGEAGGGGPWGPITEDGEEGSEGMLLPMEDMARRGFLLGSFLG